MVRSREERCGGSGEQRHRNQEWGASILLLECVPRMVCWGRKHTVVRACAGAVGLQQEGPGQQLAATGRQEEALECGVSLATKCGVVHTLSPCPQQQACPLPCASCLPDAWRLLGLLLRLRLPVLRLPVAPLRLAHHRHPSPLSAPAAS